MKVFMVDFSLFTYPYDHELCEALSLSGNDVTLYSRPLRKGESWRASARYEIRDIFYPRSERCIRESQKSIWILALKALEHVKAWRFLLKEVRQQKPNVVHLQWTVFPLLDGFFIRSLRKMVPVLLTVHDTEAFLGAATSPLQYWGWLWCLKQASSLVVHTEQSQKKLLERGLPQDQILIVPHGPLNLETFGAAAGTSQSTKTILMFGALKPYKGLDVLVEALGMVPAPQRQGWVVLVAGKPFYDLAEIKRRIAELGLEDQFRWNSEFVSESQMDVLFKAADIVVFPYKSIDVSGVLMATIPYGKAVVASRVGIFQTFLTDGQNALLFERENIQALKGCLENLMASEDLRLRLGASLKSLSRVLPSWNELAVKYNQVYRHEGRDYDRLT